MNHLKWILVVLLVVLAFILAVENYATLVTPVAFKFDLYFFEYQTSGMPLSLFAIITFLIGLFSAWLYGIRERFSLKRQIKTFQLEAKQKDDELNSLRNLPVTAEDVTSAETPEDE
jgi:uncharacterized membrane protein YciS (DUF1049 family)